MAKILFVIVAISMPWLFVIAAISMPWLKFYLSLLQCLCHGLNLICHCCNIYAMVKSKEKCGWEKLEVRREKHKLIQFYKINNNMTPEYLSDLLSMQNYERHNYNTQNSQNIVSHLSRTTYHHNSFFPSCVRLWNNLPKQIKECNSLISFKNALSSHYKSSTVQNTTMLGVAVVKFYMHV